MACQCWGWFGVSSTDHPLTLRQYPLDRRTLLWDFHEANLENPTLELTGPRVS
jgi:hypothetical protein